MTEDDVVAAILAVIDRGIADARESRKKCIFGRKVYFEGMEDGLDVLRKGLAAGRWRPTSDSHGGK